MNNPRKICVVTGTRAEYGLLQNLMQLIQNHESAELQLIVTGTHLVQEYGYTMDQIVNDGFFVNKKIEILLANDSSVAISKSMALAQIGYAEAFEELNPDIIVLLGDRYELLPAVSAALIARIAVAHIHGGEITEGAIDDSIRHAITKMSHIHFTSTENYKNRLIQMGENPSKVYHVGAPGLDQIDNLRFLNVEELSNSIGFSLDKPFGVMTYHPVTLSKDSGLGALDELLSAIDLFPELLFIITYPNSDTFGHIIIDRWQEFSSSRTNVFLVSSLGSLRYLSAVKNAKFIIGNSSSAISEAPSLHTPSINIGDRQKGRIAADSVIHCGENKDEIIDAIKSSMTSKMQNRAKKVVSPYKKGNASSQILEIIINSNINNIIKKSFFDIKVTY